MIPEANAAPAGPQAVPRPDNGKLYAALAKAQAEFPTIKRGREVEVATRTGGTYKYSYAELVDILAAVRPVLAKHELSILQVLRPSSRGMILVTKLAHSSGQVEESELPIDVNQPPQQLGSQITYLKRYQLTAMIGIAAEDDDDGRAAQAGHQKPSNGRQSAPRGGEPPVKPQGQGPTPPAAGERKADPKKKISEKQLSRMFAIGNRAIQEGRWGETIEEFAKEALSLASLKEMNNGQYEWLCKILETGNEADARKALAEARAKKAQAKPAEAPAAPAQEGGSPDDFANFTG